MRFDLRWLSYAPFTMSGVVIAAGLFGAGSQVLNSLDWWDRIDSVPMVGNTVSWWLLGPLLVAATLVLVSVLAIIGYAVTNWGFTLSYTADGSWHLRRGLLTTRETSIDGDRVRGVPSAPPSDSGWLAAGGSRPSSPAWTAGSRAVRPWCRPLPQPSSRPPPATYWAPTSR